MIGWENLIQMELQITNLISELKLGSKSQFVLQQHLLDPLNEFLKRPSKMVRFDVVKLGSQIAKFKNENEQIVIDIDQVNKNIEKLGQIIEYIHAGSLIVDDIQDESPIRRGGPSLHKIQGVSSAINSGNWLYFYAFHQLRDFSLPIDTKIQLQEMFEKTLYWAHLGQAIDLGVRIHEVEQSDISELCNLSQKYKTGVLMGLALASGFALTTQSKLQIDKIYEYGQNFGVLLQKFDDLKNILSLAHVEFKGLDTEKLKNQKELEDLFLMRVSSIWSLLSQKLSKQEYQDFLCLFGEKIKLQEIQKKLLERNFFQDAHFEILKEYKDLKTMFTEFLAQELCFNANQVLIISKNFDFIYEKLEIQK